MTVGEAKDIVKELKGRFDLPFNSDDKSLIEKLYNEVLGKTFKATTCQTCYHDALIEIHCFLKKYNKMKVHANYRLKAGAIIHSTSFRSGEVFSNDNLTDEVAKEYLAMFPAQAYLFQTIPDKSPKVDAQLDGSKAGSVKKGAKEA